MKTGLLKRKAIMLALLGAVTTAPIATSAFADHHGGGHNDMKAHAALEMALAAQPDETKARYQYRHPKETLDFFGIKPGMTVGEILPGGGWYSKILLPYLGVKGKLIGVDYSLAMWTVWRGEDAVDFLEARKTWADTWAADASKWREEIGPKISADVSAFALGAVPENIAGTLDAMLIIRGMQHLNRFEDKGEFRGPGLKDIYTALKPGGIVGIVQHRAPEANSDDWANGSNGYLKQTSLIENMKAAGFELVAASEVNANPKDKPTEEDFVWRLPPSLAGTKDKPELRAKNIEIGESDRMTLKFRKPE